MKRLLITALSVFCLAGCGAQETFETVNDVLVQPVMATSQQVRLSLPESAAMPTMDNGAGGKLYLCDGYTVTVQTFSGGNLNETLQQVTGFTREMLTLMETTQENITRYDCAWSSMGEGEDQVCRCAILDDGTYHYVVTVMAPESKAGSFTETWQALLSSITLVNTD